MNFVVDLKHCASECKDEPASDADLLRAAPAQNRLVLFALFAREQRRLLESDRADTIDYLHELAQAGGLYWDFGIDAVQLELSRVFG
jgi:hypothetical protein